jgi:LysR family transcriptional regulator, cys regulon transcriptional activator
MPMKLQQLRYVLEIVRQNNHLSAAAEALHTSQPGVSRQIQLLEAELGFEIFLRTRNRIIGPTEPGRLVVEIAKRVVTDMAALRALKDDVNSAARGTLTIGTTHTQARYVLPHVIESFVKSHPDVQLILRQGNPEEICALVDAGEADLAIGTDTINALPNLVKLPCSALPRSVVARKGHPILEVADLTLAAIARYPIISYDPRYSGRWRVMNAFKKANLDPKIILSAIDADVCKTYIELGLGIGVLTTITFDPERDVLLGARDASHLFDPSTIFISLRANTFLRGFMLDFIKAVAPRLTPAVVRNALRDAEPRKGASA